MFTIRTHSPIFDPSPGPCHSHVQPPMQAIAVVLVVVVLVVVVLVVVVVVAHPDAHGISIVLPAYACGGWL